MNNIVSGSREKTSNQVLCDYFPQKYIDRNEEKSAETDYTTLQLLCLLLQIRNQNTLSAGGGGEKLSIRLRMIVLEKNQPNQECL